MKQSLFLLVFILAINVLSAQINDSVLEGFIKVDSEASFIGGEKAYFQYLQENLKGWLPADNGAPIGKYKVEVRFIVNVDGSIDSIYPLTNHGYGLEEEVVRIIKASKKWQPALLNGKPVKAYRKQPVTFGTEEDGVEFKSKMSYVFYTNTDNDLSIYIRNAKGSNKNIVTTTSLGEITQLDNGNFTLKFDKSGRTLLQVKNIKTNKILAQAYFDVIDKK